MRTAAASDWMLAVNGRKNEHHERRTKQMKSEEYGVAKPEMSKEGLLPAVGLVCIEIGSRQRYVAERKEAPQLRVRCQCVEAVRDQ
jgi:hypothetical protein